jgi:hypothetical protein
MGGWFISFKLLLLFLALGSFVENVAETTVVFFQTARFQNAVFFQQRLAFRRQSAAVSSVSMNDAFTQVLLGDFDFAPDPFVAHFHFLCGLVDGSGFFDGFQNFLSPFPYDDAILVVNDPVSAFQF